MKQEALELGRQTVSIQRKINVDTTSTLLLEESTDRISIIVNSPASFKFTMSLASTAVLDEGISVYLNNRPIILTLAEHGQLVTLAWTAISETSAQDVTIIETFQR